MDTMRGADAEQSGKTFCAIPWIQPIPQLVPLFEPLYLSIRGLPAPAKAVARKRLGVEIERAEAWGRPELAALIGSARSTIDFMDAADTTANLPDFFSL
jgi:hypothetical protein